MMRALIKSLFGIVTLILTPLVTWYIAMEHVLAKNSSLWHAVLVLFFCLLMIHIGYNFLLIENFGERYFYEPIFMMAIMIAMLLITIFNKKLKTIIHLQQQEIGKYLEIYIYGSTI